MKVSEGPDAETVGGMKLALQELTAGVSHVVQLKQVGGGQERLNIVLGHINTAGVHIVH